MKSLEAELNPPISKKVYNYIYNYKEHLVCLGVGEGQGQQSF